MTALQPNAQGASGDPLPEALQIVREASSQGLTIKILGGLGVRVLCPDFPPRQRAGQDIDFACLSRGRKEIIAYLREAPRVATKPLVIGKPRASAVYTSVAELSQGPRGVASADYTTLVKTGPRVL